MMSSISKTFFLGFLLMTAACQTPIKPAIIPPAEVKTITTQGLEIIGGIEPVYFLPIKTPFSARIDTGAETSSIDVTNLRVFERDGEKWVSFNLTNSDNYDSHSFEKRVKRKVSIRRIEGNEQRYVVNMDIQIGGEIINADFTLANRDKFNHQGLIGRNIISGRFMVDPSIDNTLR